MTEEINPSTTFRFRVDIEPDQTLWFMEVTGLSLPAGGGQAQPLPRLPRPRKYSNITFRKGIAGSEQALAWACSAGASVQRKNIRIALLSEDGSEANAWELRSVWPIKVSSEGSMIETLEIAYES